jgi:hypothetical protein
MKEDRLMGSRTRVRCNRTSSLDSYNSAVGEVVEVDVGDCYYFS